SIGQFFNRTHRMVLTVLTVFTAVLQEDGLPDAPSVAVKELDRPALDRSLARVWGDQPSRGGGVDVVAAAALAKEDSDGPPALVGEVDPPRLDPRETRWHRRDHRPDAAATQTLGYRPRFVGGGLRMEQVNLGEVESERRERGRIDVAARVGPDD